MSEPSNSSILSAVERIERLVGYDGNLYTYGRKYNDNNISWHQAHKADLKKVIDVLANLTTKLDLHINGYNPSGFLSDGKALFTKTSPAASVTVDGFELDLGTVAGAVQLLSAEVMKLTKRVKELEGSEILEDETEKE